VIDQAVVDRLLAKTEWRGGCLEWTGYRNKKGYGLIRVAGKSLLVHRVVWIWHHGDISSDVMVTHNCDNPACCCIDDLKLGDNVSNQAEKRERARVKGERNPNAKLTDAEIRVIRSLEGQESTGSLARQFAVHPTYIRSIQRGDYRAPVLLERA
jgi:hypothetical protein